MSRQSTVAQRNLTLTEELEKLEQSITLTLQGIDISPVLESIMPILICRNRPQFQPGSPNCNYKYIANCRSIRRTLEKCVGRL